MSTKHNPWRRRGSLFRSSEGKPFGGSVTGARRRRPRYRERTIGERIAFRVFSSYREDIPALPGKQALFSGGISVLTRGKNPVTFIDVVKFGLLAQV
jgi:hypothetical protein